MGDRELISPIEAADAAEFGRILRDCGPEQARALEAYFGAAAFERLRGLALESGARKTARGNVAVLHGIMGGELTLFQGGLPRNRIWLSIPRLIAGAFQRLALSAEDSVEHVEATGILKRSYGAQLLELHRRGWNVRAFWYDWRLDIRTLARRLRNRIEEWFSGEPFHIVAHSMGGLVARSFISQFPSLWEAMNGRLIMLGCPNHGSFDVAQLLHGYSHTLKMISLLDLKHGFGSLLETAGTFPGIYQMLPDKRLLDAAESALWNPGAYAFGPDAAYFRQASEFWDDIANAADPARMVCIMGSNRLTAVGIRDFAQLAGPEGYEYALAGDGTVPHRLSLLHAPDGRQLPAFYCDTGHAALPGDPLVCEAVHQLLLEQGAGSLRIDPAVERVDPADLLARAVARQHRWDEAAAALARTLRLAAGTGAAQLDESSFTEVERQAEEFLIADSSDESRRRTSAGND